MRPTGPVNEHQLIDSGLLSVESFGYICEDQTTGPLCRPLGGRECLGIGTREAAFPAVIQQFLFQQVVLFFSRVKVVHGHQLVSQLLQPLSFPDIKHYCHG